MALTQVRVLVNGQWHELAWNPATARYEGELTAPAETSWHQTGHYYDLTVEAVNDTGVTAEANGEYIPGLRWKVLEVVPPVLTLISPPEGHLTENRPEIVLEALDAGSGVDLSTLSVLLDGFSDLSGASWAEIEGGCRIAYTPSAPFGEGVHTVEVSLSDHDGNLSSLSMRYVIDTIPPELEGAVQDRRVLVDTPSVSLAGRVSDVALVGLSAAVNGSDAGAVDVAPDGRFSHTVPLEVGENHITLTAVDIAGLTTEISLRVIRLVTDRTQADVSSLSSLLRAIQKGTASQEQIAEFLLARHRGAYNHTDLNRVTLALEYLHQILTEKGYITGYQPAKDGWWVVDDIPIVSQMLRYLSNVKGMQTLFTAATPDSPVFPEDMEKLTVSSANGIEKALVVIDALFPLMEKSLFYSGEVFSGEI